VRADLAGGTLDLWPLGLFHPGAVTVAVAVSLRVEVRVGRPRQRGRLELRSVDLGLEANITRSGSGRPEPALALLERLGRLLSPEQGASIESRSPVRAGSGLGTSSALGVAAAAALARLGGRPARRDRMVATVRDVEAEILGIPTGVQDHWAAVCGGVVLLEHKPDGPSIEVSAAPLAGLSERLLLVDSGRGRSSGPSNWDMFRRRIEGEPSAVRAFGEIADAGRSARDAIIAQDWRALGRAMTRDLDARAELSPLVMTAELGRLFEVAHRSGALGARVCGAGGGGFAAVLARDGDARERTAQALGAGGFAVANARPTRRGLVVRNVSPAVDVNRPRG
jgi:D-glycero-alpha-D-manno-heptose-7-phosphate kinase